MKNVYINTVSSYGNPFKRRSVLAVIMGISLLLYNSTIKAQNCPTSGTTVLSVNENTYYPGTQATVNAGATSITLGAIGAGANFGVTPIASGDIVLIIQMQGAQILVPTPTTNSLYGGNSSGVGSGMLAAGLMAGNMEFAVASNAVPIAGGTLNIASGLTYSYSYSPFGTNGQYTYQVIRVSTHYNIQLGAAINAPNWNGSTGGVTVISAVNQLDMNGQSVNANGAGFRGGGGRSLGGQTGLNKNDFYGLSTNNAHASKAEGVAGTPRYVFFGGALVNTGVEGYPSGSYARGGAGNAGGGASDSDPDNNDQNAGGGGGGNGGAGGVGGNGWFSFGTTGGRGGTAFRTYGPSTFYYSPGRLILGGGGGAGTTNNGSGTPGAGAASSGSAGGGLIILNATTIIGTGTVNANGAVGNSTVTVDGSGGGGAGGSILIYANSGQAGITANAIGADGASNFPAGNGATQHGPGGGGGGGVIYSNNALNVASSVAPGASGISHGSTNTDNFGAGGGLIGVLTQTFPFSQLPPKMQLCQSIVLPVTLLSFSANYESANNVKLVWTTSNEIDVNYFVVERSTDRSSFTDIAQVSALGTVNPINHYSAQDQLTNVTSGIVYYRLRIVDINGNISYSRIIPVKLDQPENIISVFPNPLDSYVFVNFTSDKTGSGILRLFDNAGKQLLTKSFTYTNGNNSIPVDQLGYLPKGIYVIQVMVNTNLYTQKLVKK